MSANSSKQNAEVLERDAEQKSEREEAPGAMNAESQHPVASESDDSRAADALEPVTPSSDAAEPDSPAPTPASQSPASTDGTTDTPSEAAAAAPAQAPSQSQPEGEAQAPAPTPPLSQPEAEAPAPTPPLSQPEAEAPTQTPTQPQPEAEAPAQTPPQPQPEAEAQAQTPPQPQPEAEAQAQTPPQPQPEGEALDLALPQAETTAESGQSPASQPAADETVQRSPEETLQGLENDLSKASFKNTTVLQGARKRLRSLRKQLDESATELIERVQGLEATLTELLEKNQAYQEELQTVTTGLLAELKTALESGQSMEALPTWDRIQGNLSNTSGKLRDALQEQANEFKARINELRDWKLFAATEKKKELIQQAQALKETELHPADLSKRIAAMHREWKNLGRSDQNDALWKEFKQHSDLAYEPCKDYFKQRKQLMAENLEKRRALCQELETELAGIDREQINISALSKLLKASDQSWKQAAPVEQNKIKSLQKQYYAVVNELRKLRKGAIRHNGSLKQDLVERAEQLTGLEDHQQAMEQAKALQKEWQQVGPTTFKEDRKYWDAFRAACDKIFDRRRQQAEQKQAELKQAEQQLETTLQSLDGLMALSDEDFRQARSQYQSLLQEFAAALDPKLRQSKARYTDRLNEAKRRIQARFDALPDKKQLALQETVRDQAQQLARLEESLLQAGTEQDYRAVLDSLEQESSSQLTPTGDAAIDARFQQRLERIKQADSAPTLESAMQAAEEELRKLCIETEIRAEVDSPAEDQGQRMALQLAQLKEAFGQQKPDRKEVLRLIHSATLQGISIGPLDETRRAPLMDRLRACGG